MRAIKKFEQRLQLPNNLKFNLISLKKNSTVLDQKDSFIELYHSVRYDTEREKINEKIMKNGFIPSISGNKGPGIYLADHSRYSIWAGGCPYSSIICHVKIDQSKIKRYKSEIKSNIWNSEFVVSDPKIIYPRYLVHFDLIHISNEPINPYLFGYTHRNDYQCDNRECLSKWRCDCEIFPTINKENIV